MIAAGRQKLADRLLDQIALYEAEVEGDYAIIGQVAQARAWQSFLASDLGGYLEGMEKAATSFDRCGDLRHACHALGNVGYAASELGDYARAESPERRPEARLRLRLRSRQDPVAQLDAPRRRHAHRVNRRRVEVGLLGGDRKIGAHRCGQHRPVGGSGGRL